MNKRVVRRLLETFFRRWWLYLLPVVLFVAAGVAKGMDSSSGYQSIGVIDVSKGTLLSQLTSIRGENFGYDTPAGSTARTMNSLLRTDSFIHAIAESAGLQGPLERGEFTEFQLRQSIYAAPDGDTLLQVVATTYDPSLSAKVAKATIDSFIQYVLAGDVSESRNAEAFFESQLTTYGKALDAAQAALTGYADAHPGGPQDARPLDEQIEIGRLKSAVDQAQAQYTTAQQKSEEARLATEQSTSDATQRLRIVDEPEVPPVPQPRLKQEVFTVVLFTFVGTPLIVVGAVVLATVMDRSLRSADDVEQLLGVPVLAVVPASVEVEALQTRAEKAHSGPVRPIEANKSLARPAAVSRASERPSGRSAGTRAPTNGHRDVDRHVVAADRQDSLEPGSSSRRRSTVVPPIAHEATS